MPKPARRIPPVVKLTSKQDPDSNKPIAVVDTESEENAIRLVDAFGTLSLSFYSAEIGRLMNVIAPGGEVPSEHVMNAALALVASVKPRNETEAALAVQMAGTHALSMEMLRRLWKATDPQRADTYANIATKVQRTFLGQLDTLQRMRKRGGQKVTVRHTHVYNQGGQALVAERITGGTPAGYLEKLERPHELDAAAVALEPALRSPEPGRPALSGPKGTGQAEVLATRRRSKVGRAYG